MTISVRDAVVAIVNGPDLEDVQVYEESFHLKQASISVYGDAVDVDGSLSHGRRMSSDDQVYYSITIRNGMLDKIEKKIQEGGITRFASIVEDVAAKAVQLNGVPISKDDIHGFLNNLDGAIYGGDAWQFASDRIIAGVALTVLQEALDGMPPKTPYLITVKTGSDEDAGTDANVYIRLIGDNSEAMRFLASKFRMMDDFESGRYAQDYEIQVEDIGQLRGIKVGHDNSGSKPGWLLETVTVQGGNSGKKRIFVWNNWISAGTVPATSAGFETPLLTPSQVPVPYAVTVKTGSKDSSGTDANVWIQLLNRSSRAKTGRYVLAEAGKNNFEKNQTDSFAISGEDVGDVTHIVLGHDGRGEKSGWFVETVTVRRDDTGAERRFVVNRWLAKDEPGSIPDGPGRMTEAIPSAG